MKLNIHLTSHPIIRYLSNIIINEQIESHHHSLILKQLGLFTTYETLRNHLKTYKLTIKQIKKEKEIIMIDPKESYLIIFNNLQYLSLLQEIQLIIPTITLKLIETRNLNTKIRHSNKLEAINAHTKIIIINNKIEIEYLFNLLHYLTYENKIKIHQICLSCIQCETNQLITISKKYSKLNIYTSNIVDY